MTATTATAPTSIRFSTSAWCWAHTTAAKNLSWLGFDGTLSWAGKLGVALSVGVLAARRISTAHSKGKKDSLERWLQITLAQTYGHFSSTTVAITSGVHRRTRHVGAVRRDVSGDSCPTVLSAACARPFIWCWLRRSASAWVSHDVRNTNA